MRKVIAIYFGFALSIFAEPAPSAKDILASVRMIEARQQIDLQGQLRENDIVVPFRLTQNGPLIRYSFTDPDEALQLRLGERSSRLDLLRSSSNKSAAPALLTKTLRSNFSIGRPRASSAKKMSAPAIVGNCSCARLRRSRSIPMFCYGSTRRAAR
jgi:hypothetical protein